MALNYDFDMLSITAKASPGAEATEPGPVALFRDAATVEALERAPQVVQDYLRASYFGINCYHSGAPAGRYPDTDEAARIAVIEALAWNVAKFALPHANDLQPMPDAFHLPAFFAAVAEAEPIAMPAAPEAAPTVTEAAPVVMAGEPVAETATPETAAPADDLIACLILTEAQRVDTLAKAPAAADSFIARMFAEDPAPAADVAPDNLFSDLNAEALAPEAEFATDTLIAGMIADDPASDADIATDGMIAEMMATETPVAHADADEAQPAMPPPRFRLPSLPRWMTAGAAFTVLGVVFGNALL